MDIIAAHRHGLIEQLEDEVAALAGRPRDHGQRAVVLHHLYDHSRGNFVWPLAEARRALWIVKGIATLERRLDRWGWTFGRREEAVAALAVLADVLGQVARQRAHSAYRAYRLSATPALRPEAELLISAELLAALDDCHAGRRSGEELGPKARASLSAEMEAFLAPASSPESLAAAWTAIDATGLRRAARRLIGDKALERRAARDERRGCLRVERELRMDETLPASFRANPAQHFYALQHMLAERRRQQWREACDREPDAFGLAA